MSESDYKKGISDERERCVAIIEAARLDEIDRDWRAIIHMIEMGESVADLIERAKR